jgi:hypothetical protein
MKKSSLLALWNAGFSQHNSLISGFFFNTIEGEEVIQVLGRRGKSFHLDLEEETQKALDFRIRTHGVTMNSACFLPDGFFSDHMGGDKRFFARVPIIPMTKDLPE